MAPEKKTEKEISANDTHNEDKRNGKSIVDDWEKLAVVVSVIGLVISSLLTAGLTFYSFQLTEQANSIAQKSLDLQNSLSNFTTNIIPNTDRIYLEGWYLNGTTPPISSSGWFNFSLLIFTPYLGTAKVTLENFTTVDYESMLEPDKGVSFDNSSFLYNNPDQPVDSGLHKVAFSFYLSLSTYPIHNKLTQTSEPNIFAVGILNLDATFTNTDGKVIKTEPFYQIIILSIRTTP